MNIALLMMGGSGQRVGADIPKQFIKIKQKPVFLYILEALDRLACIDAIVLVVHRDWLTYTQQCCRDYRVQKVRGVVEGGMNRSSSVLNGLRKAREFAGDEDVVMMFDATHPYVDKAGIEQLIGAVKQYGGATLGQRQYDTCYRVDENDMLCAVLPRQSVVSGASPEGFRFQTIYEIYTKASPKELASMSSAGAIALAHHVPMKICSLNTLNLKITYQQDVDMLNRMINLYFPEDTDA